MEKTIRILIIDDSSLMREALRSILSADPALEVVGLAKDGREGVEKALALKPDVITMDLRMPAMSGLEAIEEIMEQNPIPIIVVSSMDVSIIVKALGIGAMDFVAVTQDLEEIAKDLVEKIKIASRIKPLRRMKLRPLEKKYVPSKKQISPRIIAIGVSTGGPQALQVLFNKLPANLDAGVVVVQHIADGFIEGLVEWMRTISSLDVHVAKAGDIVKAGTVFFAPDGYHMLVDKDGVIRLKEDLSKRALHVPSIDELMKSVAASYGKNAIAVMMTGMGSDGVEGIGLVQKLGGITIAQDEKSSVIFGMNKIAVEKGYIDRVIALEKIADALIDLACLS